MIFSACRINRECREKIQTKINNKQDRVTCRDFCYSLVHLVLHTTHTVYKYKHVYLDIMTLNRIQGVCTRWKYWRVSSTWWWRTNTAKYDHWWNIKVFLVENEPYISHVSVNGLSLAWFDYKVLLYKKWTKDGFSMPLKLYVQVSTENCFPIAPFLIVSVQVPTENCFPFAPFLIARVTIVVERIILNGYIKVWRCKMIELSSCILWQSPIFNINVTQFTGFDT